MSQNENIKNQVGHGEYMQVNLFYFVAFPQMQAGVRGGTLIVILTPI